MTRRDEEEDGAEGNWETGETPLDSTTLPITGVPNYIGATTYKGTPGLHTLVCLLWTNTLIREPYSSSVSGSSHMSQGSEISILVCPQPTLSCPQQISYFLGQAIPTQDIAYFLNKKSTNTVAFPCKEGPPTL